MNSFVINAKLPSLNEYIAAINHNRHTGNKFKQDIEELIGWAIKQALVKGTVRPTKTPCVVRFTWCEKEARRDCDNIASAKKFILDAMQKQGIIVNDNQRYIKGFEDIFVKGDEYFVVVDLLDK